MPSPTPSSPPSPSPSPTPLQESPHPNSRCSTRYADAVVLTYGMWNPGCIPGVDGDTKGGAQSQALAAPIHTARRRESAKAGTRSSHALLMRIILGVIILPTCCKAPAVTHGCAGQEARRGSKQACLP
eukprot:2394850-Rhodomonas_salina.1